ncbi:MAG: O-antigen ligase family protein [Planctomycetota bacterium]|jgi:putative inorganic carbon (HCO3(-)) transporter
MDFAVKEAEGSPMGALAMVLAGAAIIASAFHFWPFEASRAWQVLCPSNLAVLVWMLICGMWMLRRETRRKVSWLLPHISVLAYVAINVLSLAFAPELARAINFTMKLALMLIAGYMLLNFALSTEKRLKITYILTAAAAAITIAYCLAARFGAGSETFGFQRSAYKYGTYVGVLVPLCGVYLLTDSRPWAKVFGGMLVATAILSSGSLGAVAAIVVGLALSVVLLRPLSVRLCIVGSVVCGISAVILLGSHPATATLKDDIRLAEQDGLNLRQRYIEWQAETNLLQQRTVTGTGPGCVNTYRSSFYYRLPKLNTIKAFEQNGYLTTAAETGILGLVCFCWIVLHYGRRAFSQVATTRRKSDLTHHRFAAANLAGLAGAVVANAFSSVHYNGILIVFVLILALIARTQQLYEEQSHA